MENRERDRMSQRDSSTDAGDLNRKTEQERGSSGTGTEFGKNIGRSENLGEEGGNMRNKDQENMNQERGSEESRRPSGDRGFESGDKSEKMDRSEKNDNRSGNIGSSGERGENRSDRSKRSGSMDEH
jgi:hypothetical protein